MEGSAFPAAAAPAYSLFCGPDIVLPPEGAPSGGRREPVLPAFAENPFEGNGEFPRGAAFRFMERAFAALELDEDQAAAIPGASRVPLRQYIGAANQAEAAFALKAKAYAHWSSMSRHCSFCGAPLAPGRGRETEGAMVCGACGRAYFPRISPAIIVLVSRGEEILLAHNAKFPAGRHGLIAGFVEPGETLEETVHREVMEETGLKIGEPRYVMSQPWPFPDSLMVAFEAEYESGEARPDGVELDHLGWYSPGALPEIPPPGSVAHCLIRRFIDAREKTHRANS